ncbi:PKD domain-containing protein [Lewinella sp. IMCC34191]|uniref:PKD domain-containing protein n=1 Tax=Lewinella sp. IMCC34191 TaxID=2259172 RepID=UPI000E2381A2|nr:PKD domain-containing protein [Lewinella sp. IMCC34191]
MRIFTLLLFTLTTSWIFGQSCPADFDFTATSCNEYQFTPRSGAAGTYKWNFGDGSSSTKKNPTHIFGADGSFDVTLITGGSCVPDTVTRTVSVSASDVPDASIESVGIYNFVNCAPTDDPSYELRINNTSSTASTNIYYIVDWGDGSTPYEGATLPNLTKHTYTSVGLYDIKVSVQGGNGCWAKKTFEFFYGSNPGGNIVPVSNQIACVPENVEFRISGTEDNPPGTIYKIWVNDGSGDTTYFNHPPPTNFSYYLTTSPCESDETANNYFNIYFEATNPCFTQSGGTIIRANKAPEMDFEADDVACEGGVVEIRNNSEPALYAVGNTCSFEMLTEWSINADPSKYEIVAGSLNDENGLDIRFNEAGEYVITLNYTPKYSNACTSPPMTQTICILPEPEASYDAVNADPESCTPLTLDVTNTSNTLETCGAEATYEWMVEYLPSDCGDGDGDFTVLEGSGKDGLHGRDLKIQFESAGIYRLGLKTENECGPDEYWEEFVVAEAPLVEIEPIEDVCFDGPITVTPTANISLDCTDPPAFTWDFDGGKGGDRNSLDPGPVTFDAPGVYTIRLRVSNSCGTTVVTETFEIAAAPDLPEIIVTEETCESSSIAADLAGSGSGLTFSWTGPDGFTSDQAEWSIPNAKPKNNGDYTVTVTNATGCSSTKTYNVVVNPGAPIDVNGGDDVEICSGESVTLTATGGASYTWTGDHLSGSTGSSVTFSHDVPGVYTIEVLGIDPEGRCDATDEIKVTVHAYPVADAGDPQIACVDEKIELEGSPSSRALKGTWSGDFVTEDGEFKAPAAGTYTLTYTYTNEAGCSDSDQTTVCVRDEAVADFTLPEALGCMPAGLALRPSNLTSAVTACDVAEMSWTIAAAKNACSTGGIAFVEGTDANSFEPVIEITEAGNYLLTLTVTSACGTSTHTEKVAVGETPVMEVSPIDTLCGAQDVTFAPRGGYCDIETTTYTWEFPTASPPSTSTRLQPLPVRFEKGEHTVTLTATNSCGTHTVTETFVVAGDVSVNIDISQDEVCRDGGATIAVTNNSTGDIEGVSWNVIAPTGDVFATSSERSPTFSINPTTPMGSYRIEAVLAVAGCSDITWDTLVLVGGTPELTIDEIALGCGGNSFVPVANYDAAVDMIDSVRWTFPAGSVPATSSDLAPGEVTLGTYGNGLEVSLTVYNACGTTTVTETFDVEEPAVVDIDFDRSGVCQGETVSITNNSTGAGLTYSWSVSPAADVVISDANAAAPTFTFNGGVGTYTITATVSDGVCTNETIEHEVSVAVLPVVTVTEIDDACGQVRVRPTVDFGIDASLIDSVRYIITGVTGANAGVTIYHDEPWGRHYDVREAGDYLFTAIAYNGCALDGVSAEEPFTVLDGPPVSFTVDKDITCSEGTITATNTSAITKNPRFYLLDASGNTVAYESRSPATFTFPSYMLAGEYTIRLELDDKKCGTGFEETTVYLTGEPEVTLNAIPDGCGSATVNLSATHTDSTLLTGINWQIRDGSGTLVYEDNTFSPAATTLGAGDYTATATVTNDCGTDQSQRTFTVVPGTAPTFTLDVTETCAGESVTATNTTSGLSDISFYLFDSEGNQLLDVSDSPATFVLGPAFAPGTYTIRMQGESADCGGGTVSTELTFDVMPAPSVIVDPVADGCGLLAFTPAATVENATSIEWEIVDALGATVYTDASFTPARANLPAGNYTLTATVANACESASDAVTFEVTEGEKPVMALDSDNICAGGNIVASNVSTGLTDIAFTVTDAGGATVASGNGSPFTFGNTLPAGDYTLRMEGNNASCGGLMSIDTLVTVAERATVSLTPVADKCGTITFTPAATYEFASAISWEIRNASGSVVYSDATFSPAAVTLGGGSYTLSVSVSNGCGNATDAVSFAVSGDIASSVSFDLDRDQKCEGSSFTVTNTSTGLSNVAFTIMDRWGNAIEQSTDSPFTFGDDLMAGTYTVRLTGDSDACDRASVSKDTTITIQSEPLVKVDPVADQCGSVTFAPSARITGAAVIEWTIRNTAGEVVYTDVTFDPAEVTLTRGFYTLVAEVANNCGIADDATTFEVTEGDSPEFTLDNTLACSGTTITATNTTTGLTNLVFTVLDQAGATVASSNTSPFTFGDDLPLGTYTVRMEGTSATCSSGTVSIEQTVSVVDQPTITIAPVADACGAVTVSPSATVTAASGIQWTIHNASGELIYSDDNFEPGLITLSAGTYELAAEVTNDCHAASDAVSFTIDPAPTPVVRLDTDNTCEGQIITARSQSTDLNNPRYTVINESGFTVATGAGASFDFGPGLAPGNYTLTLSGTSASCAGTAVSVDTTVIFRARPVVKLDRVAGNCGSVTFTPSASYTSAEGIHWAIRDAAGRQVYADVTFDPAEVTLTPGFYTLTAVVYNDCGSDDDVTSFEVGSGTEPTFSLDSENVCEGQTFTVTNTTTDLSNLKFTVLDATGATVATGTSSPFIFGTSLSAGTYTVRMEGNSLSCSTGVVMQEQDVAILSLPTVSVDPVAESCGRSDFIPTATTEYAMAMEWEIQDEMGTTVYTDNRMNPKRADLPAGEYTLIARVINDCGRAEDRTAFTVNPGPVVNFSLNSSAICSGGSIVAVNRSTGDIDDVTFDVLDADDNVIMTSTDETATFTFGEELAIGTYTIRLTVSSLTCSPVSNRTTITLGRSPNIVLDPIPDQCAPAEIQLSATHTDPAYINFINWQIRNENGQLVYNNDTFDPVPDSLYEGTYYVTATVANECGVSRSRDTFNLLNTVTPVLNVDLATICAGETFTASNGTTHLNDVAFTVTDATGATVASSTTSPFVFGDDLAAGSYTLRMEGNSSICGNGLVIDTVLTVSAGPTVQLDPVADVCGSLTLTPGATITDAMAIAWKIVDATGLPVYADDTFVPQEVVLETGTYTLSAEVTNDCGSERDEVTFTVTAPEAPTFTLSSEDACEGETITVTNTTSGLTDVTFTVRNDLDGIVASGTGSPFTFGNRLAGGTYTVAMTGKRTDCNDASVSTDTTVTVRPAPTVELASVAGSCGSLTFTPSADVSDATTINWTIRNGSGTVVYTDNTFTPQSVSLGAGFYTLAVDVANDCGIAEDLTSFEITEGTAPTFAIDTEEVCGGGSFTVTNTTPDLANLSITVLDADGAVVASATTSPFTFGADLGAGAYTVRMEGESTSCPAGPASVERTVTVSGAPRIVVDPVADACGSLTFAPSATTTFADAIRWSIANGAGDVLYTDNSFDPEQVTLGIGSYEMTATVSNDCGTADYVVTFQVQSGTEPVFSLDTDESCEGTTFTATNQTASLASPRFTVVDEDGATVASGNGSPFRFGAKLAPGSYTVQMDGFDTACGDTPVSTQSAIVIFADPSVSVDPVAGTCGSLTFTPSADFDQVTAMDWKIRNAAGDLVYSDATLTPAEVTLGPGFYTLLVSGTNDCAAASDFTTFEITQGSPATMALNTDDVCTGETVTVTNTSTDLANLRFTVTDADGLTVATGTSSPFTFGADLAAGTYTVRMEGESVSCASGTIGTEATVVIKATPTVLVEAVADFCGESDFTPRATLTDAETILWQVADSDGATVYTNATFDPLNVKLSAGTYTLKVTAGNDCGSATDFTEFTVSPAPAANFSLSSSSVCTGGSITATKLSGDDVTDFTFTVLDSDFNVVATSKDSPATFTFGEDLPVGEYIVRLDVSSATCAPATNSARIKVGALPTIALLPTPDNCGPAQVQLSATHSDPARINFINWQIRDDAGKLVYNSDAYVPPVADLAEGTYHVTAMVANECGVVRSRDTFHLFEAPEPAFTVDTDVACQGGTVTVTNTSEGDVTDFTFSLIDPMGTTMLTSSASPATFSIGEALPDGEYTIRLAAGNPECALETAETTITVGGAPTIEVIAQPDYCGPNTVSLSAAHTGASSIAWKITDAKDRVVFESNVEDAPTLNLNPGTYVAAATATSGCGSVTDRDTFRIFAEPTPSFTVSSDLVCQGGTLSVTNTSTGDVTDFTFDLVDPAGITVLTSNASPANFTIGAGMAKGTYTLRMTAGNPECGMKTDEMTITIGGVPTVDVLPQPDFCGPTTVSLSAATAGAKRMEWLVTNAAGATVFASNIPDGPTLNLEPDTYIVAVTATSDCGTTVDRDTFRIYDDSTPSFAVDNDIVCQGGTLRVTNTSSDDLTDFTFSLIDPMGTTLATSQSSPANFAIDEGWANGEYTLRLTAGNPECGMQDMDAVITVGGVPTIQLTAQPDFCGPTTVALSAAINGANSASWTITDANQATVFESNIPDNPTLSLAPGTYLVTVNAASDCGTTVARDTFRIYAEPVADIDLSATNLCLDGSQTVTVSNRSTGADLTYDWTVTPAGAVAIDNPNAAEPTFTFTGVGTYELSAVISNPSCDPITWTGSVTVKESVEPVLTYQDRFCEQVDLTPIVNYGGGAVDSVRWTFPGSVGDLTSSDRFPRAIPYREAGTYVYKLTVFNACGESTVADTIHIDSTPELTMGGRDTVCILDGLYVLTSPTPAGGSWMDADGRAGVVTADGNFDPVAAGTGVTVLEYTYTDGACAVTGTREVFVIEEPEVTVAEPVLDACESDTYFVLSNGNPMGGWYEGPGVIDRSGVMDPSSLGAGTYTLTYYYRPAGMTCTGSVDFTVNVRPGPIAQIDAPNYVCIDEPVQFKQTGTGGVSYVWRNSDEPPVRVANPVFTFRTPGIHTVTLTAYNEFGCAHEVVKHVNVTGTPVARFEKEQDVACDDVPFTFYNNSQVFGEAVYFWDFGNGRTSNSENPAPVLFERGSVDTTYLVSLTVTNDCGTHTYSEEVTITTEPVAAFELSEEAGCSQLNVSFDNQTAGTRNKYKWFVNGELYSIEATPPARSFVAQGAQNAAFDITLVAYNACGSDTLTRTVISKPNELRVRFSADERTGCDPFTVQFRNFTSPDSLVSYAWDFGDGYSSDEENPEHTFRNTTDAVKTYNVTLVADNGCVQDEITLPVTVYPAPDVSFEVASATCVGDSVFFRNTSGRVTDFVWTFGDGNTVKDVENPGHVFPGPGEYTVTLSAKVEGADCPGVFSQKITIREAPQVDLTAENVVGCPPLQVDLKNLTESGAYYSWDFGDGNTAVGAEPRTHTYTTPGTYEITLTVRDESGCSNDAVFSSVEVHAVPEVEFAADASQACGVPQTVCFTNNTTGGTGYNWDFGNGLTSGLNTPCITYTEAATYNVTLKATNEFLCEATASAPLYIYGEPVAEFSIPDTAACVSGELPFTSESSNTDFIKWTFSDGYVSEEEDFSRRFEQPGFYDVTVIAGNGSGCADTATFTEFVEIFPRPLADFDYDNAEGEVMNTIQFTDRSSADAVLFGWDFGDGYGSDEMDPVHRYVSGFDKTVYHWVENVYGCQDTVSKKVDLEMLVGLFVPNVFTPEDNTIEEQDVFKPKGIGLEDYYIAVYTRTGQLVWESEAIDAEGSPTEAWDGTFQGLPAKPGTYVWRVHRAKFRNGRGWTGMANETGTIAKTGYITLLR